MKKFRKLFSRNLVSQFLYSYILVLIIPMVILFYGFYAAFTIVEDDIRESNIAMLTKSMYLLNEEVRALETLALQTSQYSPLRELGTMTERNGDYITTVKDVISEFYTLINYQSLPLLDAAYIYLNQMDLVIYNHSVYHPDVFELYTSSWGMTLEEWYDMCRNGIGRSPHYYISPDGAVQYIIPFSNSLFGENQGVIVYRYSKREFDRLLSFTNEYDEYSTFILDDSSQVIYSSDQLGLRDKILSADLDNNGFTTLDSNYMIYTTAQHPSWKYILALPRKTSHTQLTVLQNLVLILVLVAAAIGVLISLLLSILKVRPINTLIHSVMTEEELAEQAPNLGNLVSVILSRLVDTFSSRILYLMLLSSVNYSIDAV